MENALMKNPPPGNSNGCKKKKRQSNKPFLTGKTPGAVVVCFQGWVVSSWLMNLSYLAPSPKEGNRKCADEHIEPMEALQSHINQLALWKYLGCTRSKQAKEAVSCVSRGDNVACLHAGRVDGSPHCRVNYRQGTCVTASLCVQCFCGSLDTQANKEFVPASFHLFSFPGMQHQSASTRPELGDFMYAHNLSFVFKTLSIQLTTLALNFKQSVWRFAGRARSEAHRQLQSCHLAWSRQLLLAVPDTGSIAAMQKWQLLCLSSMEFEVWRALRPGKRSELYRRKGSGKQNQILPFQQCIVDCFSIFTHFYHQY